MTRPTFLRFLFVGLVNTGVGYAVIVLLQYGVGVDRRLANAGGYLLGGAVSYALNRNYTFKSRRGHAHAVPRFVLASLLCFGLNLAVLEFGVVVLELPGALAQAVAMGSYTLAFYTLNRLHVFRA